MKKIPNFFIIGAARAGTTSIYKHLSKVNGIFMSPRKEPNFFSKWTVPDNHITKPVRKLENYIELFAEVREERIIGEASVSYLTDLKTASLIKEFSPSAKILISLRDPINRAYAGYFGKVRSGFITKSFHDMLDYSIQNYDIRDEKIIPLFRYYDHVTKYQKLFGKDNVKIIIFEEFIQSPQKCIEEILNFLNLPQNFKIDSIKTAYNSGLIPRSIFVQKIYRNSIMKKIAKNVLSEKLQKNVKNNLIFTKTKPEISKADMKKLINFYSEDVKKISKLLKRDLPWENFIQI